MGGIAIWCMHFIGNRAIQMADGEPSLQIAYSSGFTAFSFFMPILVLVAAFVAIGTNDKVSWWRVAIGGTLAGAAICGMHYLGNASINNYVCIYNIANVVGAALIAVAASIIALSLFFVFRAGWTSSWWKRIISAVLLAGAVSGMHWCASTGTSYKLIALAGDNNQLSRNETVIVVICLVSCEVNSESPAVWVKLTKGKTSVCGGMSCHGKLRHVHRSHNAAICQQGTAGRFGSSCVRQARPCSCQPGWVATQ